jgi:RND family efflux transporter MFP subunit
MACRQVWIINWRSPISNGRLAHRSLSEAWGDEAMTVRLQATTMFCSVLLAAAGCSSPAVETVATTEAVPVTVEAARVDTLTSVIAVTGSVVPAPGADWIITAPGPARIAELPKAEGAAVREGDLLVRFDIPTLPADLAAKRAEVAQATARLELAKASVTRTTALLAQGVGPGRDVDEAKQQQADAEAALAQAQSAVSAAMALSDRAIVLARFAGVVAKRWHNPGDLVDASTTDPILRIINPRQLQVVAAVPVAELSRVVLGHTARIIGPAGGPGEPATVVSTPAQIDPTSVTADVRLAFSAPTRLASGTGVQLEILADEHPKALVVPTAAIVHDGDETFVMVAGTDNKAHKHPVVVGLATHDLTEVTSGVKAGDLVIVRGQDGLPDGGTITVVK